MRIAFVDLEFAWPPPGGAQYDVLHTMTGLKGMGHDVRLFCRRDPDVWRYSGVEPGSFPHPVTELEFTLADYTIEKVPPAFREAVDGWKPDIVFLCFCFFFRPYLADALAHYPLIDRFYTYESLCIKDFALFKQDTTCANDYVNTPNACLRCFAWSWRKGVLHGTVSPFARNFLDVDGFSAAYHEKFVQHLRTVNAIVVYNEMTRQRLLGVNPNIHVVPGGVHTREFAYSPAPLKGRDEKKIIFMSGRADDYLKGVNTLLYACDILADRRDDFEVWVTHTDPTKSRPWLKNLGWRPQGEVAKLYAESDICVVPSIWDEPFGMVAVEAMASGRPVCVSRVGGLQHIVEHEVSGFVFERKSHLELAVYLNRLLDNPDQRRAMGEAGRRRAEEEYDWARVVERFYPPIFEKILP